MRRHYVIPLVVIVRAGVVWSGVGTLAVALLVGLLAPLSLPFACDVEEGPLRSPWGDEMC